MKDKLFLTLVVVGAIAVGIVGSCLLCGGDDVSEEVGVVAQPGESLVADGGSASQGGARASESRARATPLSEISAPVEGVDVLRLADALAAIPEAAEEKDLHPRQKAILAELKAAYDDNDGVRVRKALAKFKAPVSRGGLGGHAPACMRRLAVSAAGWIGREAISDLLEYTADKDEDIASDAFAQIEQALSDCTMGDVERSQITTGLLQVLDDGDQVESLLSQLGDMRNSVKAQTAEEILTTGTETAKAKLAEQLEFYFDESVTDAGSLAQWQAKNPDDASDAEFYGGSESSEASAEPEAAESESAEPESAEGEPEPSEESEPAEEEN